MTKARAWGRSHCRSLTGPASWVARDISPGVGKGGDRWVISSLGQADKVARSLSGSAHHHKLAGHEPPTTSEGVRAVMRGIRRTIGVAPRRVQPVPAERLAAMLAGLPDTLAGQRDRAVLALGFPARSVALGWWRCRWRT